MSVEKAGWSLAEWRLATSIGRTKVYELLQDGEISASKVGTRLVITTPPREFLERCAIKAARVMARKKLKPGGAATPRRPGDFGKLRSAAITDNLSNLPLGRCAMTKRLKVSAIVHSPDSDRQIVVAGQKARTLRALVKNPRKRRSRKDRVAAVLVSLTEIAEKWESDSSRICQFSDVFGKVGFPTEPPRGPILSS